MFNKYISLEGSANKQQESAVHHEDSFESTVPKIKGISWRSEEKYSIKELKSIPSEIDRMDLGVPIKFDYRETQCPICKNNIDFRMHQVTSSVCGKIFHYRCISKR